ncbi:methyltransferase domain-containing protein [candidate division WOR-3 bacterium]|nr:methyltransferase domain-containing protein [candidate division WOR-3 bacterium]
MKPDEIKNCADLNKKFYEENSMSFSFSRRFSDPAWNLIFDDFSSKKTRLSILDLGCGNGRFLDYFSKKFPYYRIKYLGIDQSEEMLRIARENFKSSNGVSFQKSPISSDYIGNFKEYFNIVLALGLLHHIPERRLDFLVSLCKILEHEGLAVVSLWNFENISKGKKTPLEDSRNDFLLSWNGEKERRYCHSFSPDEVVDLCSELKNKGYRTEVFRAERKNGGVDFLLKIQKQSELKRGVFK